MSDRPFFTIGIPTYNKALVAESIQSCLWQEFTDFELIVANDYPQQTLSASMFGITDKRVRFVNHPQNLGAVPNMNFLVREARGKYFVWLSDDDMFMPDFLSTVKRMLDEHPQAACAYTSFSQGEHYPQKAPRFEGQGKVYSSREFLKLFFERKFIMQGYYAIVDTQLFQKIGGMEQMGTPWFSPYSDYLILIRIAASSENIVMADFPLIFYRVHSGSVSYVSDDYEGYRTSQLALLEVCQKVFKAPRLAKDFDDNLFNMLKEFVKHFFEVARRSAKITPAMIRAYLNGLKPYERQLGKNRWKYPVMILGNVLILLKNMATVKIKKLCKSL